MQRGHTTIADLSSTSSYIKVASKPTSP